MKFRNCHNYVFKVSMDRIGCTTPFGVNPVGNYTICNEKDAMLKAIDIFKNMTESQLKECPYPCKFLKVSLTPSKARSEDHHQKGVLMMTFNKYIRVTNAEYSYTELELLAEFGGYVGLFLGMSVFHLSDMFDKILDCIAPIF